MRIGDSGLGVRFRAPANTELANVALYWTRPAIGCTVTLHPDDEGALGDPIVGVEVPAGVGWQSVPLSAPLYVGAVYHLAVRCPAPGRARIAHVLDGEHGAVNGGVWQLEDLRRPERPRRAPTSPLFALVFADGTWWGQPYRPGRRHVHPLTVGGSEVAAATVVAGKPLMITGLELPTRDPGAPDQLSYSVSAAGGPALAAEHLARSRNDAATFQPESLGQPLALQAGTAYVVRLAAPNAGPRGLRVRALRTDLALGPPLSGLQPLGIKMSHDGGKNWHSEPANTLNASFLLVPETGGGACGNGIVEPGEGCDGVADAACPERCTLSCACAAVPPGGATGDPVAPPGGSYRSIYAAGFAGAYDNHGPTTTEWPRKLALIEIDATNDGPKVEGYKDASVAAGNTAARYWFYASLTSIDSKCGCRDQRMYESFSGHEDFFLHDGGGHRISTFVAEIGSGRQIATDVGNPAFADAWADYQLATMKKEGWDGVWADNVICAWDVGTNWSATPINPRTGAPYANADYRRDLAAALGRIHDRLAAAGKHILGNHGGSCIADFFNDSSARDQLLNMDGAAIENCVYDFWNSGCGCNQPHAEKTYIDQLRYLSFANRSGKQTECIVQHGGVDTDHRSYGLASYLLTKERYSLIGELNHVGEYWTGPPGGSRGLDTDLGAPSGDFYCLDPAHGLARSPNGSPGCPGTGKLYGRDFANGRVLTNPTGSSYSVDLGGTFNCDGKSVSSVTLGSKAGAVCTR